MSKVALTKNAQIVLEKRYLSRNAQGKLLETPEQLFRRVAKAVCASEKKDRSQWGKRFFEIMASLRFLPNTPTLINAGKKAGQLSACYVLPIEDSLDGIFETLKQAAKIHQSGGGTGFSFSRLRPAGSFVKATRGIASGPVSFMKIYDQATETIKQGGVRRGANMAVLRVDHPDILEFINSKRDQKSLTNFNISVGITRKFMDAVKKKEHFELKDPATKKRVRKTNADQLFDRMCEAAWECGDPGLVFLDQINKFNPTPNEGEIESTNPCGEQPLLPYESCNLGSLNLGSYVMQGEFDWQLFRKDIGVAVRFLDNVIDINAFPVPESRAITLKNRKIGLGVMGYADALLALNLPYDAPEAFLFAEKAMTFLDGIAKEASAALAKIRGPFPNWKGSRWHKKGDAPLRNATLSTVAPTGTISIIAGCSSGIEPIFSESYFRNVLSGEKLVETHSLLQKGKAWRTAQDVSVESHIETQAAFQRHSDSGVSKTINLPQSATTEVIRKAYLLAYEKGCKGITVYRDRSRSTQVLEAKEICTNC